MASIDDILRRAILEEQDAQAMYSRLAAEAGNAQAKALLQGLATDEKEHEDALTSLKADELIAQKIQLVDDLRITDFLEEKSIFSESSFQEILVFAAKKEDVSWKTYEALAEQAGDADVRRLFERLAAEEESHKNCSVSPQMAHPAS